MLQTIKSGDLVMLRPVALTATDVLACGADDMHVLAILFDDNGYVMYQEWYGWLTDYIDWDKQVWLPKPVRVYSNNCNGVSIIPVDVPWDGDGSWSTCSGNSAYYWVIGTAALEPMPHITQTRRLTVKRARRGECSTSEIR